MPTQNDFNIVKAPGLYHYDGGLFNAPSGSPNFRSIELGSSNRYSQIAMPWDADQMFFRRKQDTTFTTWREVIHNGNIGSYTYTKTEVNNALALKYSQASGSILENQIIAIQTALHENYYLKAETLQIFNSGLALKQDTLIFPLEGTSEGWGLISSDNVVRRLSGGNNIQVQGVLDLQSPGTITEIKVSLTTNPTITGNLTVNGNLNTEASNWILGFVNGTATPPTFTDLGGFVKNVTVARDAGNVYTISWDTAHPKSTNYGINLTPIGNGSTPRIRVYPPGGTNFQIICTTSGSFQQANFMITIFK